AGKPNRTRKERVQLDAVLGRGAAAILVVDADKEGDQVPRALRILPGDRAVELVGGPARARDDLRLVDPGAPRAQAAHQLHRPRAVALDALADRVAVAEREVAQRHFAICTPVAFASRKIVVSCLAATMFSESMVACIVLIW